MKPLTLVLLLLLATNPLLAQKENNVWVGGYESAIDFNSGSPVVFKRLDDTGIWRSNASICDSAGNLLFYTNGYRIFNRNYQVMQNGNNHNIGDYAGLNDKLSVPDGAAIVPVPDNAGKYYVFHTDLNFTTWGIFTDILMPTHLYYSLVDMNLAGGLGDVVSGQKDILILSDTITAGGFKLAKHGNGRDYWLLCHEVNSDRYYRFLINLQGVQGPFEQHVGLPITDYDASGFSTLQFDISDDKAVQLYKASTSAILYEFNRCTGEFFDPIHFVISDTLLLARCGAFSSNGHYFYAAASPYYIWQFDLTAANIAASRKFVAHYSGALNPFETDFADMELAPDGRIYINSWAGNFSVHAINHPDSSAEHCGFVENGLQLEPPGWTWDGMPNTVHHSLGPLYGSGCDTLTSPQPLPKPVFTFGVYPNPFSSQFQVGVSSAATKALIEVYDVLGQKVFTNEVVPFNHFIHQSVDLSEYASGVYFVSVDVNGTRYSRTIVKK